MMAAGLKGDHDRAAAGRLPGLGQRAWFGMRLAELGVELTPPLPGEFNVIRVPWSYYSYSHLVMSHQVSPNDMLEYWTRLQKGFWTR